MDVRLFLKELKRRNVYRVAVAYFVVAWMVLQIISVIAPMIDAPDWIGKAALIILMVGFPVALILAWAFELSPAGKIRTSSTATPENHFPESGKKVSISNVIIGILLLVIVSQFVFGKFWTSRDASRAEMSIAVLPFKLIGSDQEGAYFADGIFDVLISQLNKIEDLKVRSRTSVERFASPTESIREIGEKLDVQFIIQGSAQKYEEDIRIMVQLIDPVSDDHLWEQAYDRKYTDIFNVQSEIALSITNALGLIISPSEKKDLERFPTSNEKAWDFYTQANYYANQYDKSVNPVDYKIAIEFYDKAFEEDSSFALALSKKALAMINRHLWADNLRDNEPLQDSIYQLAIKALSMDDQNEINHQVLGEYYYWVTKDFDRAFYHLRKAVALKPNFSDAYRSISKVFNQIGISNIPFDGAPFDSALVYAKKALEYDPSQKSSDLLSTISLIYTNYGDFTLAKTYSEAALKIEPDNIPILNRLTGLKSYLHDYEGALETAQRMNAIEKDNQGLIAIALTYLYQRDFHKSQDFFERYYALPSSIHAYLNHQRSAYAYVLRKNGNEKEAIRQIEFTRDLLLKRAKLLNYDMSYDLAKVYSFLGEKEFALNYIESFEPWYGLHSWIKTDPLFDNIKDEPRFKAVVKRCDVWADSMKTVVQNGLTNHLFPGVDLIRKEQFAKNRMYQN